MTHVERKTFDAVVRIIEPFFADDDWTGGIRRFYGLTPSLGWWILDLWPELREDRQNFAPSFEEMLEDADEDGMVDGYVVDFERADCRVTLDGLAFRVDDMTRLVDLLVHAHPDDTYWADEDHEFLHLWWD